MRIEVKLVTEVENKIQFFPDSAESEKGLNQAAQTVSKNVELPGFRKGKVPLDVVKKRYQSHIDEIYAERLVYENLSNVIKENDWSVIEPGIFIEKDEKTGGWVHQEGQVVVRIEVLPKLEVKIPKVALEPETVKVEEDEVQKELDSIRQRLSELKPIEGSREARAGDILLLKELKAEAALTSEADVTPDSKKEDQNLFRYEVQAEENKKPDDFVGIRMGEIRQVAWDAPDPNASDKTAPPIKTPRKFMCKEISMRVLPEVNNEFCKKVGNFETVDALNAAIRKELTHRKVKQVKDKNRALIMEKTVEANSVAIPSGLEHRMLNEQVNQAVHTLSMLKVPEEQMKTYLDQHKDNLKKSAQDRAKFSIISMVYAKKSGLSVGDAELQSAWKHLKANEETAERPIEESQRIRLKQMLLEEKVLEAIQKSV